MATFEKRGTRWRAQVYISATNRPQKTFGKKHLAVAWANEVEISAASFTPEKITIQQIVKKYIDEVVNNHKGARQETLRLNRIILYFPDLPISKLNKDVFSAWKTDLLKKVKPGTVRRYMTTLNAVFNHAMNDWGYLNNNPLKGIKKPSDAPHRERVPADSEIKRILKRLGYSSSMAVTKTKQQQIAVSLLIAIESAMRAGEILSICPGNTNLKLRTVDLIDTKNNDRRQVPLSSEAVRLIKLLPGRAFDVSSAVHSKLFSEAVKSLGIDNLRFHDSRAAGLMKLSKKVDVLTLARIVGHRSPASLMIYYRAKASDIAKLLD